MRGQNRPRSRHPPQHNIGRHKQPGGGTYTAREQTALEEAARYETGAHLCAGGAATPNKGRDTEAWESASPSDRWMQGR